MELTGCNLQSYYDKLESLRDVLEKPWKLTDHLEALTILEAEIAELAFSAEDMVDLKSRKWIGMMNRYTNSKDLKAQNLTLEGTSEHALEPENMMGWVELAKTILATKLYKDPCIMSRFVIHAKAIVSKEYCVRNVLLSLLSCINGKTNEFHEQQQNGQLADRLQKCLKGRRYLVVIDDIWTTEAWDDIKLCFPDCINGSRILLTTRNVEVAEYASSGKPPYHMRLMNLNESWSLLYEKVFAKDSFPSEFEQLGKQIASKCRGLPLAIVVIAGLLSKIGKTLDEWQSVSENVSSVLSTDLEAQCMRVLALSYCHLPSHLKPCFLYFAILAKNELISLDKLVELWDVEGFLKVEDIKSIEEVAETCLNELIAKSLISVHNLSFDGKIKNCGMHDVIHELCLREARNMNFVNVHGRTRDQNPCSAHLRVEELPFNLVRVLDLDLIGCASFPSGILCLIHLRYLALRLYPCLEQSLGFEGEVPSSLIDILPSMSSLCYLQTFILSLPFSIDCQYPFILPSEILTIPRLRHLRLDWNYFQYHELTEKSLLLNNLQYLSGVNPWYCTASSFRLFPNLKKLQICGVREDFCSHKDMNDFRYLDQLKELVFDLRYPCSSCFLESVTRSGSTRQDPLKFQIKMQESPPADDLPPLFLPPPDAFPQKLKNLVLSGTSLRWKDLSIVGKLPKLMTLTITCDACISEEWEVVNEGFPHLKFLLLQGLDFEYWTASCDHFPCLERLFIEDCEYLDSIPLEFADVTTLSLIDIRYCPESVGISAKQIQQDIQDNYGSSIDVHINQAM
ncbi:hypothetical protein R3W88_032437 [Solanum pinnatisectum]|uniref:NB-ARC domain-containing protein n=1 Tax=Solanum pinnatisectum TaxID=50273 RepID=A0AAV9LSS8_9SOLN|nr:hypothetical protein R3W88_032437 [Solanum pinnatisectum]